MDAASQQLAGRRPLSTAQLLLVLSPVLLDLLYPAPSRPPPSPYYSSDSSSDDDMDDDDSDFPDLLRLASRHNMRDCEAATGFWEDTVKPSNNYTDENFRQDFRLTRQSFFALNLLLEPHWLGVQWPGRPPVKCDKALAMCLWRLANIGTIRVIARVFDMSAGWADGIIKRMLLVMEKALVDEVCLPSDATAWSNLREQWKIRAPFPNVVAAVDGSHIPLEYKPNADTNAYYNRKAFFSILLQGTVAAGGFFLHTQIGSPGSVHDSRNLSLSHGLLRQLAHTLPQHHYILADAAYPLLPWCLTPYRRGGGELTAQQIKYNKTLSSTRVHIEIVYGKLKGRFRSLNRLPYKREEYNIRHVVVACRLHNWLLKVDDDVTEEWMAAQSKENAEMARAMRESQQFVHEEEERESLIDLYRQHRANDRPYFGRQLPPVAAPYRVQLDATWQQRYDDFFQRSWRMDETRAKQIGDHLRQKITEQWF